MNNNFINNDTIALAFLGVVAICGVLFKMENVTIGAMSAIGGYIGAKAVEAKA